MSFPYLDAVSADDRASADTIAVNTASPELLAKAAKWLSEKAHPSAAHVDNSNPAHPVIRPDPPPGTSDDDPGAHGASRDDSHDTNI